MAHHNGNSVNALWRALKTSTAEPLASKLGEKLGSYFLNHPSIIGILDGVSSDWRNMLATAVKAGGGVAEIPGKGPVVYILNESLDAFVVGLGRSLQDLKDMSPDEIANDLFAISAIDKAANRLEEVLPKKVKLDLIERTFHFEPCMSAKGKPSTLLEAIQQGFAPKNCQCTGRVWNGFQDAIEKEEEESSKTPAVEILTIIELMDAIEKDAIDTDDAVLLGHIAHFRAEFTSLSEALRLKFEYLAKEKRSKEKLRLLIGYKDSEWEQVIDAMLDDPIQAKADGVIKTIVGGFGKIGDHFTKRLDEEGEEADNLLTSIESAFTADTEKRLEARNDKAVEGFLGRFEQYKKPRVDFLAIMAYVSFAALIATIIFVAVR